MAGASKQAPLTMALGRNQHLRGFNIGEPLMARIRLCREPTHVAEAASTARPQDNSVAFAEDDEAVRQIIR